MLTARISVGAMCRKRIGDAVAQSGDISQPQVEPLRRHRVQAMRRIADKHGALRRQSRRLAQGQRVRGAPANARKATQSIAEIFLPGYFTIDAVILLKYPMILSMVSFLNSFVQYSTLK